MPSQQQVKWSQLKVGVLILVALVALTALIFLMSGTSGFFQGRFTVRSYFSNSAGLKVGAPVNLEGVTIGSVKAVRIAASHNTTPVEVFMRVNKKYQPVLREDSRATLVTVGVLGDTVVEIDSKHAVGPPIQNNGVLPTTETANISDVIASSQSTILQLNDILTKMNAMVDGINNGQGSIGMLVKDPALYNKTIGILNQVQALVKTINSDKGTLGKLINDPTLYNRANEAVGQLQDVANNINSGQGTIGKLIKDPALYNNLEQSSKNLDQMLAKINSGKGALGMMTNDQAFANKLNSTVTQLNQILTQVNSGQGTIGMLLKDDRLYNHTDQLMTSSTSLMHAIRKNPKKYLTIHLKIF